MPKPPPALFPSMEGQLLAIPVRNERVSRLPGPEPGTAVFEVELVYRRLKWLARLLKARRHKHIVLEGLALALYDRLDGQITVGGLVAWLMEDQWLTFHEARGVVVHGLHLLVQRGLVAVMVPRQE